MSRSGYSDDIKDYWGWIRWRGAVASATSGTRGQFLLRDLRTGLDDMENKRLIAGDLIADGEVCALGAVGLMREVDLEALDPYDYNAVGDCFDVAPALVREIVYVNDEEGFDDETPESRWQRVSNWVDNHLKERDNGKKC